jgi:hypothetical protein
MRVPSGAVAIVRSSCWNPSSLLGRGEWRVVVQTLCNLAGALAAHCCKRELKGHECDDGLQ